MGLDVGSRTIGVALSDELRQVANGILTLDRQGTVKDVDRLLELVEEHDVTKLVVGLPLEMSGRIGHRARRVLVLVKALEERWKGPIETWDERLSTVAAERALLEADLSRRKRKAMVDRVAAAVILQGYLDSQNAQGRDREQEPSDLPKG